MTAESPTAADLLRCPRCQMFPLPEPAVPGGPVDCPACRSQLTFALFPAIHRPADLVSTASGEMALDGESVCFFHAEKRAATSCERCGRFLCALCDVPFGGRHLCPSCLDSAKMPELVKRRFIGAYAAFMLGALPIIAFPAAAVVWPLLPCTGLAAIIVGLWTWNKLPSIVLPPRKWMAIAGILGGILQLAGTWAFVYFIYSAIRNGR